jgi:hypothetical protein
MSEIASPDIFIEEYKLVPYDPLEAGCVDKDAIESLRVPGGAAGIGEVVAYAIEQDNPDLLEEREITITGLSRLSTALLASQINVHPNIHDLCAKIRQAQSISERIANWGSDMATHAHAINPNVNDRTFNNVIDASQRFLERHAIPSPEETYRDLQCGEPEARVTEDDHAVELVMLDRTAQTASGFVVIKSMGLRFNAEAAKASETPFYVATPALFSAKVATPLSAHLGIPRENIDAGYAALTAATYMELQDHLGQTQGVNLQLMARAA